MLNLECIIQNSYLQRWSNNPFLSIHILLSYMNNGAKIIKKIIFTKMTIEKSSLQR